MKDGHDKGSIPFGNRAGQRQGDKKSEQGVVATKKQRQ